MLVLISISFLLKKKKKKEVTNYTSTNWQCVITEGRWHFLSLSPKKQSDSASGVLIRVQFTSMKIESIVPSLYILTFYDNNFWNISRVKLWQGPQSTTVLIFCMC